MAASRPSRRIAYRTSRTLVADTVRGTRLLNHPISGFYLAQLVPQAASTEDSAPPRVYRRYGVPLFSLLLVPFVALGLHSSKRQ